MKTDHEILANFIVLEGIDGAGTTTQLDLVTNQLGASHIPHFRTCEPTDYSTGRALRTILKGDDRVEPGTIAHLFAADRYEHLHHKGSGILSRLKRGELVVCDRYLFSSLAYQSINLNFEMVYTLNRHFPLPGHLFFLDVPVAVCQQRLDTRTTREIFENSSFQEQVLSGYHRVLDFFSGSAMQIHRLDGTLPPAEIFQKIWKIITGLPIIKI